VPPAAAGGAQYGRGDDFEDLPVPATAAAVAASLAAVASHPIHHDSSDEKTNSEEKTNSGEKSNSGDKEVSGSAPGLGTSEQPVTSNKLDADVNWASLTSCIAVNQPPPPLPMNWTRHRRRLFERGCV
jgi:hypothetical protein